MMMKLTSMIDVTFNAPSHGTSNTSSPELFTFTSLPYTDQLRHEPSYQKQRYTSSFKLAL